MGRQPERGAEGNSEQRPSPELGLSITAFAIPFCPLMVLDLVANPAYRRVLDMVRRDMAYLVVRKTHRIEQRGEPPAQQLKRARVISQDDIVDSITAGGQTEPPPDELDAQCLGDEAVVFGDGWPELSCGTGI
jgi:hypothetical protein